MERWTRARYQPVLPLGKDGKRITACEEHITLSKEAAKEGMVLLKNEGNVLPLKKGTKVALFGKATFDYVKGGGGSGDVTVSYSRNLYEGFLAVAGREAVFDDLAQFYKKNVAEQYGDGKQPGMTEEPKLPEELCRKARAFSDTAVISICRFSGEGWDRDSRDYELTPQERAMVETVKSFFDKVIVVLNVGGIVDTEWFREEKGIQCWRVMEALREVWQLRSFCLETEIPVANSLIPLQRSLKTILLPQVFMNRLTMWIIQKIYMWDTVILRLFPALGRK